MIRKTSQKKERFRGERLGRKSKKGMPKREKNKKEKNKRRKPKGGKAMEGKTKKETGFALRPDQVFVGLSSFQVEIYLLTCLIWP